MAQSIEIKADGESIEADKMLAMALRTLRLLKAIEKDVASPRKPSIRWRVDMMSGFDYGLIFLRAEDPKEEAERVHEDALVLFKRLKERGFSVTEEATAGAAK